MKFKACFVIFLLLLVIDRCVCDEKSSLTLVIDNTASMTDDIDAVKVGANAIFDTVMRSNSSQIEDFVLVTFNDPTTQFRTKTKDRSIFKKELRDITLRGNLDCPEMAMAGIKQGIQNSREGSTIYVFTDASAKDYEKYDEVEALSQKMGCQIVFVLTGICYGDKKALEYVVYNKLAKATNGQVFHLEKSEIGEILKYVQNTIENRKNILTSKTFAAGYGNKFDVPIDGDTKELVIAVSGERPSVSVTDSGGTTLPTTDITRLSEIAVVKIVGVTPGLYTVEVGSKDETHVVVSGTTSVHFQHGFSTISPSDIKNTVTRPVPGVKSHLSIKLSTKDGNVELHSVQILDMNDNVISETPLKFVNKTEQFYTTAKIMPPDHMFKVAIKGYDVNRKTFLTRIGLTPIKPQEIKPAEVKRAPVVECDAKVNAAYGKPVELKCKVSGYPKPDVIWETDDKSDVFSHFESIKELPYDYISVLTISNVRKNGTYTCKAANSVGSGESSTAVETKMDRYFKVIAFPKDTIIEYQKSVKIPCKIKAFPPATVSWYKGGRPLNLDGNLELSEDGSVLTIRSMEPKIADNYICEARNDVRRKIFKFSVDITGVEAPEINKKITSITAVKNSKVEIPCQVIKGKPKPTIRWYYRNAAGSDILHNATDTIDLYNVNDTDSGSYTCVAENVVDKDIHGIDLFVEYKPLISRPYPSVLTADLGNEVTLRCSIVGEPAPRITWKLNGVPISSTTRHTIYADGTLRFYAISSDEGVYECEASNTHGIDRINYKLHIYVPVDIESPTNSFIELMEGSRVTLPCRADGSPKPSITWIYHTKDAKVGPSRIRPSDDTGRLSFDRIQLRQSGEYTCVATNSRSSKNITYEVLVLAPPKIYYTTKEFHAVVGDMVLRIPCNASGNPKPDITWTMEGYYIASGTKWYDISADGSLIIKNIKERSAGYYSCKASNDYGQAEEEFDVVVDDFPDPGYHINKLKLRKGDSAMIPCNIPRKKTDKLLWFKDGRLLPSSDLAFRVLTESDSGTYTCRVSSMNRPAQSGSTTIEVGSTPRFEYPDYNKNISFVPREFATLDCSATGLPKPEVQWYHNNRPISFKTFKYILNMYSDYDKGRYTCVVSNSYGTVQRDFVVSALGCLLDVKHDFSKNGPLMLTSDNNVTNFKTSGGYMRIPKDETIKLVCPSSFNTIPLREMLVTCENAKQFLHQSSGRRYAYSDLKCRDKWQPIVKKTGRRCAKRKAEILNVGFEIGETFETVYEVCLNRDSKNPIYTKIDMQPSLAYAVVNSKYSNSEWFDYRPSVDLNALYDCSNQNAEISAILNKEFHRSDGCCFAKRMLVNPVDVAPGLQGATYIHLNVVPHWSTCNSKNWKEVEHRIRNLVVSSDRTLQVFTGKAYNLQLPDAYSRVGNVVFSSRGKDVQVPKYLWKVVQDPSTESSLAIIQVNVPDLRLASAHSYQLCNDVCKKTKWMQSGHWRNVNQGFTYCCSLADFERAFRYQGVFPDFKKLLRA